eukprot:4661766-Amphidinium_carterae.1
MGRIYTQRHLGVGLLGQEGSAISISLKNKQFVACGDDTLRLSSWIVVHKGIPVHVHTVYFHTASTEQWSSLNVGLAHQVLARVRLLSSSCAWRFPGSSD